MLTRAGLQQLAEVRLADAILLLQANRASSAYYLAGYAVELALKACVSKLVQPNTIPDKAFINATIRSRGLTVRTSRPSFFASA